MNRSALFPFISIVLIYLLSTSGFGIIFVPFFPIIFLNFYEHAAKKQRFLSAALLVFFVAGALFSLNAVIFLCLAVFPSILLAILHRSGNAKNWRTVVIPTIPAFIFTALAVSIPHIRELFQNELVKAIETLYASLNLGDAERLSDSLLNKFYINRVQNARQAVLLSPAAVFSGISMICYFTELIRFRTLPHWIIPLPDIFLSLIASGGLLAALPVNWVNTDILKFMGFNFLLIAASLYFYRGFDLLLYFMNRWKLSPFFRFFFCILVLLESLLMLLVSVLGVISVFKNFVKDEKTDKV
ncbi:MAG: DUF2232 domain-containing protein [Deferribacteraceae bacterium]|jgi:hypothetical protein|nr:DUF2232 domain-containing protein [Deferribacteraceae bacterium]